MLLVAFERRRKNADQVEIAMRLQFVPVPGTDIVCNARFERPRFARSEVGHLPAAGEDVVCFLCFLVMLVPEGGFGSGDQMHI